MSIQSIGTGTPIVGTTFPAPNEPQATARQSQPAQKTDNQATPSSATSEQVKDAVKSMNDFVHSINSSLNFSVDKDSGETVVKVMDVDTKEVIKQIPSEEMLAIAKAVDKLKGLLVQQKA